MNTPDPARESFTVTHEVHDGVERISYWPKNPKHSTPILFQHGMWHGAWCWERWQMILAQQGWESHAISLPGHGASPVQRPVRFCGLGYYLSFLTREIDRLPQKPILIGHSMGGALAQWYLKKVADDLPATILVASWTSHSTWADGSLLHMKRDPIGMLLVGLTFSTDPFIRNAQQAASMLVTDDAIYTPEELHKKLNKESAIVLNQHNPPFWTPKRDLKTPMLWLAAEKDAVVSLKGAQNSAKFYGADFVGIADSGHNLMMEKSHHVTALKIDAWLSERTL